MSFWTLLWLFYSWPSETKTMEYPRSHEPIWNYLSFSCSGVTIMKSNKNLIKWIWFIQKQLKQVLPPTKKRYFLFCKKWFHNLETTWFYTILIVTFNGATLWSKMIICKSAIAFLWTKISNHFIFIRMMLASAAPLKKTKNIVETTEDSPKQSALISEFEIKIRFNKCTFKKSQNWQKMLRLERQTNFLAQPSFKTSLSYINKLILIQFCLINNSVIICCVSQWCMFIIA